MAEGNVSLSTEYCSGELQYATSVILAILHSISGAVSIIGNVAVLLAVYLTPSLHTPSNYYIASLGAGDFLVGIVIGPLWVTKSALNVWQNQHPLTVAAELMSMQTLITTTFNLAAVSFDRYLAITRSYFYMQTMTQHRCFISIGFIWAFSFAFACIRLAINEPTDLPYLWIAVAIIGYTLPFVVISYSYYHIYKAARHQLRRIEADSRAASVFDEGRKSGVGSVNCESQRSRKAANTIGIIIGIYVLLAFPSIVIVCIQLYSTSACLKIRYIRFWFWGALVSFVSSAVNPWIYGIRNRDYKRAFKRVFKCWFSRQGQQREAHRQSTRPSTC
ncbi:trace amine-associated receptor 9-like [Acropora palmata]|uniref:trace amine-associated receptor 9-like n=1 Tax=Acropora palmata TaxID=6131 RepID=UPI003DA07025